MIVGWLRPVNENSVGTPLCALQFSAASSPLRCVDRWRLDKAGCSDAKGELPMSPLIVRSNWLLVWMNCVRNPC